MDITLKLINLQDALEMTSLSRSTFYRYVKAGHIPKPVQIGIQRVAWRLSDILEFCKHGIAR